MCMGSFAGKPGKEWSESDIEEAFREIMRETPDGARFDAFVQFAYGFTQNLSLAQEVVLKKLEDALRRHLHTYDPTRYKGKKCPFCNWLYFMIARAAIKAAQREARWRARLLALQVQAQQQQPPRRAQPPPAPGPALEVREALWELAQPYLDRFRPSSREAIVLCWKEGLTCAQAAQKVGCSKGAMKVRLHRARHELLAIMQTCCRVDKGGLCHES
jgi:RNA polymerase sigma factor (sigma-70 family)